MNILNTEEKEVIPENKRVAGCLQVRVASIPKHNRCVDPHLREMWDPRQLTFLRNINSPRPHALQHFVRLTLPQLTWIVIKPKIVIKPINPMDIVFSHVALSLNKFVLNLLISKSPKNKTWISRGIKNHHFSLHKANTKLTK